MAIPANNNAMANELAAFERRFWDSLPVEVQTAINTHRSGNTVALFATTAEVMYATRHRLKNKASRRLLAKLAAYCGVHGFHELREGRGFGIARAMERDCEEALPEGATYQDPSDDPAPASWVQVEGPSATPAPDIVAPEPEVFLPVDDVAPTPEAAT